MKTQWKLRLARTGIVLGLGMFGCLTLGSVDCRVAWALEGPGADTREETIPQDSIAEHLTDHVVEYGELAELIHYFNPTIQNMDISKQDSLNDYTKALEELEAERDDVRRKKHDAKDDGDMEDYQDYLIQEKTYTMAISSYNKMIERTNSKSSNSSRRQLEQQLTSAVQSLVIAYDNMSQQLETLKQLERVYQKQAELAEVKLSAGSATQADVLAAQNQVLEARTSIGSLENSLKQIYDNICQMTGQPQDGSVQIAQVPSEDGSRLAAMDLESDTETAINNNQTIRNYRSSLSTASTSAQAYKDRTLSSTEENLRINMSGLYDSVWQAKDALDAAQTGYQKAQKEWELAQTQYSLGMLSEDMYLAKELSYLQQKASWKQADLALVEAVETYQWAVSGVADVSS